MAARLFNAGSVNLNNGCAEPPGVVGVLVVGDDLNEMSQGSRDGEADVIAKLTQISFFKSHFAICFLILFFVVVFHTVLVTYLHKYVNVCVG